MVQTSAQSKVLETIGRSARAIRAGGFAALVTTATVVGVLLVGCGSGGGTSTTGTDVPRPPASFFGVVPQAQLKPADYEKMERAGVGTLRTGLYWNKAQPTSSFYDLDFSTFDAVVKQAAQHGIRVLPVLYGTPDWLAKDVEKRDCEDCSAYAPTTPSGLQAWQLFSAVAAKRYGPGGQFWRDNPGVPKRPVHTWQIWNEQNSKTFYRPDPDPAQYEKLLASAAEGLRSQDPKAQLILGGMFGTPGGGKPGHAIAAATFLHEMLAIKGAKNEFDGFALHPYSGSIGFVRRQVRIARRELERSGYPQASLWVTEVGWASGGRKSPLNVGSEAAQARRVTAIYRFFERHREQWDVKLVAWYAWDDSTIANDVCDFCAKTGLVDEDGDPKPAYDAYARVTG